MTLGGGLKFAAGVFAFVLILSAFYAFSGHELHSDAVRATCARHDGVTNVRNIEWSLTEDGLLAITCRDGFYTTIK